MEIEALPGAAIRLLLGFTPGSVSDRVAQIIAPALSRQLGQPVIVERHPGENGAIAAGIAARAARDGRTLFMATLGTHAIAPCIRADLPYHPVRDFTPVSLLVRAPLILVVNPGVAATSVAELIALARSSPHPLAYASSAMWGAPHLAGELFSLMADVRMTHVPYDDTRRLYSELVAGRVALTFNNVMSMRPFMESGRLRGLATTGAARSPVLPQLPTLSEAGLAGYEVMNWLGVLAPAGTLHEIAGRLSQELSAVLQTNAVRDLLSAQGVEIVGSAPPAFASHIGRELARWAPVLKKISARSTER